MGLKDKVHDGINYLVNILKREQSESGSWEYPFETGISTDCYMIILLRSLEIDDENLIKELGKRILSRQEKNGAWKIFYDEEGDGNLTATLEAYYALLYSGYYEKSDKRLRAARRFIVANGGAHKAHLFTKIMLAITGQYKWPDFFPIPLEFILLPTSFPINFYQLSVFGRANLLPIMILAEQKFILKTERSPDLSELFLREEEETEDYSEEWRDFTSLVTDGLEKIVGLPSQLKKRARTKGKQYMLAHIEKDGTFYSYFSSTFLMIFALITFNDKRLQPIIKRAVNGLKGMRTTINGYTHMQYTTASVWNTSLISYALQEAGISSEDEVVVKANQYLIQKQHHLYGDWVIHNSNASPGGWGFSNINTINPDVDDTTASLRALARSVTTNFSHRQAWDRGVLWLLSMQNEDGGWPAFEKNTNRSFLKLLPIEKAEFILADPASPDLTGRTLHFLGDFTNLKAPHPAIQAGVRSILRNQEKDGSWYGRWGICYLYGTWAAITGLTAVGVLPSHTAISKGIEWLKRIQNKDGGWGESCKSDSAGKFVPLVSTLTHTAWAVDALIAASERPMKAIDKGIDFLLTHLDREDWTTAYPKGQGMAGDFYIHYHSYRYIYPLLALSHYKNKYMASGHKNI
ncbi:terpene cyclase/mutase family protein [Robertmurraya siralis]|uniref:terpene cyclase/mutase family protein n=1 Tax=Robertmurraya siralis TaxID=77777 RepID=UPI000BA60372|nr:squalene--hopene cyclase [Bacillus sp. 7504-2]